VKEKENTVMAKRTFTQEARCDKSDSDYGTPQEGTLTEFRGRKAHQSISREIVELCEVMAMNCKITSPDGKLRGIYFGELFNIYNKISNKVVGLLIRARKYNLVEFEGETLFQGRNDKTPVYLLRTVPEVKEVFKSGQDPANFKWGTIGHLE